MQDVKVQSGAGAGTPTGSETFQAEVVAAVEAFDEAVTSATRPADKDRAAEDLEAKLGAAVQDETVRIGRSMAGQSGGGGDGGGGPGGIGPDQGGAKGPSTSKAGSGGGEGDILALMFAAGCMAYTASVGGCALAAQILSGLLGGEHEGTVDVARARRIADNGTDLANGECGEECLEDLYKDTGAKDWVDEEANEWLEDELGEKNAATAQKVLRALPCLRKLEGQTGSKLLKGISDCNVLGRDGERVATEVSNCVENGRKECMERALRCLDKDLRWTCK